VNDWASIVERHGPMVWSISYRLLGRGSDSEECFQETFLAALKLGRRQEVRDWTALLRRLAVRSAAQILRQRYRRKREQDVRPGVELSSAEADPAARAMQEESLQAVRLAVAKLTPRQAEVFWLRFVEEMSYEDIAAQLELRVSAVGVLIHKVRKRLRELTQENVCPRGGP
jgi:RNA polymerase sigma-70 factor, ECF subfamily